MFTIHDLTIDTMQESEDDDSSEDPFPLHDHANLTNLRRLFRLINHGHDVNLYNDNGETPIIIAATYGYDEALNTLLANGGDPSLCDDNEESTLLKIVKSEYADEKCIQILLDDNVHPDLGDATNWTPLHEACYRGKVTLIKRLIRSQAFLDAQTNEGITPLYTSSQYGQFDCAQVLLENGASPDINTNEGDSPLYIACQQGHTDCATLLIHNGCTVNHCNDSGMSPLAAACSEDNYDCAELLIDNYAELMPTGANSHTSPLHIAAQQQGGLCLNLLLQHVDVLDVNNMDYDTTPLFEAAINDNSYGCQLLLAKGADPNKYCVADGILNYTPLMIAARDDYLNVVAQLISGGADVNYGTFTSPLILAAKAKSFDSLNYLLDNDVDVNYVDPGENTALSSVCGLICLGDVSMTYYQELLDCVLNLLKFGADISRLFQIDVYSHVTDLPLIHSHPKLMKLILEFDGEREETREICQLKYNDWKPLYDIVELPRTLEHLCRLVIRQSLGYKRLKLIDDLPLSEPLKNYLKHTFTTA